MLSAAMRITLVAIFSGLVVAQTFQGLPSCATSCLTGFESSGTIAGCNSLDISCICSNQSFLGSIACCLAAQCSAADQAAATQYALDLCKANAVTNLPTAVSCTATSASSGSAATPATANASSSVTSAFPTGSTRTASSTSSALATKTAATQTNNAAHQRKSRVEVGLFGGLAAIAAFL